MSSSFNFDEFAKGVQHTAEQDQQRAAFAELASLARMAHDAFTAQDFCDDQAMELVSILVEGVLNGAR